MRLRCAVLFCLAVAAVPPAGATPGPGAASRGAAAVRSGAVVFEKARPALVTLRTALVPTGERSTLGSAFVVDRQGRAITNYHVVAEHALRPAQFALEYEYPEGQWQRARVLAIDVVHDLAVVQLAGHGGGRIPLFPATPGTPMRPGEPLFALGNPLDLGFTVTAGTFSGVVRGAHVSKVHFTGALNPGMSGGPALNARGEVVGVNVARMAEGELVSFLVPVGHAQALYGRALGDAPLEPGRVREEIARQLDDEQQRISAAALGSGWSAGNGGSLSVPDLLPESVDCASRTSGQTRLPLAYEVRSVSCSLRDMIYVDDDFWAGGLVYAKHVLQSRRLNPLQLARAAERVARNDLLGLRTRRFARQLCTEDFIEVQGRPSRAVVCAQAFREMPGLYEIELRVVSQDGDGQVTVSRLTLNGFSWDNGMQLVSRYMEWMR